MIHVAFGFMANMKFAFLPSEREIVERGYAPLFEVLAELPQLRADLFFSGYSELTLAREYPELVDTIKRGLSEGRFGISSNGYEHIALPFVSHECARKNIVKGIEADRRVWGIEQPEGFWPSDCAWDPTLGRALLELGIAWAFNPVSRLHESCPGGIYPDAKDFDDLLPIDIKCASDARLPMFFYRNNNYDILREPDMDEWLAAIERIKFQRDDDAIVCIGLDMETPLVVEVQGYTADGAERFRAFAQCLAETPGIRFTLMGDFLRDHPPEQEVYLRHTHWHGYGEGYWLADGSQKLVKLCEAAERDLLVCEGLLDAGEGSTALRAKVERAWEDLLMAQCSDAHFTDRWERESAHVRYPLSRVILTALDNALAAHERAAALKSALFASARRDA